MRKKHCMIGWWEIESARNHPALQDIGLCQEVPQNSVRDLRILIQETLIDKHSSDSDPLLWSVSRQTASYTIFRNQIRYVIQHNRTTQPRSFASKYFLFTNLLYDTYQKIICPAAAAAIWKAYGTGNRWKKARPDMANFLKLNFTT